MKKVLFVLCFALALGGCAQLQQVQSVVSAATKSYDNPVTRTDLDAYEAGLQVVFTGLVSYRKACLSGIADVNCKANIRKIQVYTRQIPPLLTKIRAFVDSGDKINAVEVFKTLVGLLNDAKNEAFINGVKL